jgi:sulfite oxidase
MNSGKSVAACCGALALAYACAESNFAAEKLALASGSAMYTADDVSLRDGMEGRELWVTYHGGVYDLTDFAKEHPGGAAFIKSAAGGAIEPWWQYWKKHSQSKVDVNALIAKYKIGEHSDWDGDTTPIELFDDEPSRNIEHQHLVMAEQPLETETWTPRLNEQLLTSADALYVRNHAPVPRVSSADGHKIDFVLHTADDPEILMRSIQLGNLIKEKPQKVVPSVLQCAGNRAADNIKATGPTGFSGSEFETMGVGMAGCGIWGGASLKNVLESVYGGYSIMREKNLWVEFHGLDGYFTSIPLEVANDCFRDALIATHMNGEPLNRDHGFPARILLPGIIGARSVKWLSKVVLRRSEGDSPWNARYYKAKLPGEAETLKDMPSAMKLPVQSIMLTNDASPSEPGGSQYLKRSDSRLLSGVAYSGFSGDSIAKVEVSTDQGLSWNEAKVTDSLKQFQEDDSSKEKGNFHWVKWELTTGYKDAKEVWVRAFSSGGEIQPAEPKPNPGYLFNGYHKVPIVG